LGFIVGLARFRRLDFYGNVATLSKNGFLPSYGTLSFVGLLCIGGSLVDVGFLFSMAHFGRWFYCSILIASALWFFSSAMARYLFSGCYRQWRAPSRWFSDPVWHA
jgi:hypothetical protein